MSVDVSDFPGGQITFKLLKDAPAPPLTSVTVAAPAVGGTPVKVQAPATLAYQWPVLELLPTTFSLYDASCKSLRTQPYPTNAWFVASTVQDDLLFPPLHFTVDAPAEPRQTSPTIRRRTPQFVPGNKVELLVDGDKVLPRLLEALAGAQHHVHLN